MKGKTLSAIIGLVALTGCSRVSPVYHHKEILEHEDKTGGLYREINSDAVSLTISNVVYVIPSDTSRPTYKMIEFGWRRYELADSATCLKEEVYKFDALKGDYRGETVKLVDDNCDGLVDTVTHL